MYLAVTKPKIPRQKPCPKSQKKTNKTSEKLISPLHSQNTLFARQIKHYEPTRLVKYRLKDFKPKNENKNSRKKFIII